MDQSANREASSDEEWEEWRKNIAQWRRGLEGAGIFKMSMGNGALAALHAVRHMERWNSERNPESCGGLATREKRKYRSKSTTRG